MKEFLKNFKIPLILGGCALAAIIVTLIIVTGGGSSYGLYISSAAGSVSVTNSDKVVNSSGGDMLKNGDVLTVGAGSSCIITYSGKKNSDKNYLYVGENSQIVVSSDFDGKADGELFLRSGSVIGNFAGDDQYSINIRTADAAVTTVKSVSKVSYSTNEFMSYTDLYTFMGDSNIQLYDALGNPVNNAELQIAKMWGRVVSEDGPSFEALNLGFELDELSASDLKALIAIASIIGDDFPYTIEELKAAYDAKSADKPDADPIEPSDEPTMDVTDASDNSDAIQTAEPIATTAPAPTVTTLPGQTVHVISRTEAPAATTAPPATTQAADTNSVNNSSTHIVTVIVEGEETIQEVPHGGNAVRPEDPYIAGMTFLGWDGSFENVTEDRIITAMFSGGGSDSTVMHQVTVVIGNKSNTINVEHGKSANLPNSLNIEGYIFKGWDKDFSCITSDTVITAILEAVNNHKVTFVVENDSFTVEVPHGGMAMPTYIPIADSQGNKFSGWDKSLNNILADTTITAVFVKDNVHTVTFIIDNQFYSVMVPDGENAEPPFWPVTNSQGARFAYWDKSLNNIRSDVTITAYYEDY